MTGVDVAAVAAFDGGAAEGGNVRATGAGALVLEVVVVVVADEKDVCCGLNDGRVGAGLD